MDQHIKVLGVLNIVCGALGVLGAVAILAVFGGVIGIVGAASPPSVHPAVAPSVLAVVGGAIALLLLLLSAPSIVAGIGLVRLRNWGRILGVVVSVLHLLNFPFGTALGAYGLWVLSSDRSREAFLSR
ncbi:MAG: hypothetical protein GXY47_02860 [Acidobacteria bacterium]|jgi:uncharacterized membrane protein (UPF0136 family)|nr:hypothetical protein [Acidobacteriota bacterium]